jgi:hypothetical protein
MMAVLLVGIGIVAISIAINIWQVQPFVRAFSELNRCSGFMDHITYPIKLLRIMPLLIGPLLPDIIIVGAGGLIGFGGGLLGGIISIASSCMISMAFKFSLFLAKKRRIKEALSCASY